MFAVLATYKPSSATSIGNAEPLMKVFANRG